MRGIINFFLHNSVAANLLMVFIFIMGFFGLYQIKTTFFPESPSRIITIQLVYPGASPEEMEEGVVNKIEENLIGVNGVKKTTSTSSENAASVIVEAERGFDTDLVLTDVKNAVDQISSFPIDMEPPVIYKRINYSTSYKFSISGAMDLRTLKKYARIAEDDLLELDGISRVVVSGFPEEEIEISFRESDMRALNITFDEAVNAIRGNNLLSTGGTIKTKTEDLLIRAKNKEYYAENFGDIVIRSNPNGGIIKLNQIASVQDQWVDNPSRTYINGNPAITIEVFNTTDEDMFTNSASTIAYLKEFRQKYPTVEVSKIRDGKEYLNGRIEFIKTNGLIGFIIVLVLLAMFLNARMAFWVALAIPISFAGMFLAASFLGITINVITTFGMVLVIGILVDDGIVIAENIYQHYERGVDAMTAALEGTMEVLPAVSSAILTTVIAFSSFFFIEGRLGEVFPEMAVVVIFTLIFSLVEGALILPAHIAHSKALKENTSNRISQFFERIMDFMKDKMYGPLLRVSMLYSFPTLAVCAAGLIITIGAMAGGVIRGTFFPNIESDNFGVTVEMPTGSSADQVTSVLDRVERAAFAANQKMKDRYYEGKENVIEIVEKNVGPTSYQGNMQFYLMKGEYRDSVKNRRIIDMIKKELGPIPEAETLVFGLGNIFGDPVSISLLGTNPEQLDLAVEELKMELSKIKDLTDIDDSNKEGLKEVSLTLTPKAQSLGFTLAEVLRNVRQGFFGAEIQRLQRGQDEVKVWVRYDLEDRSSISDLANMRIRSALGQSIPLSDLVTFNSERGVIAINHINGQREIRVTADVQNDKVSVSDIVADIENILLPRILERYPTVSVGLEGQAKENQEAMVSMQRTMPIILLCMLFVIILTFSSVSQALIVFMLIPFGFIGVGFGHWFMDVPINLFSALGIIALVGILVNDALVFISTFNDNIRNGMPFNDALYKTGVSRFRPITLTTITTVAGLLPLMLEKSTQAQFLIPMAISVAFGLIISTFILLIMIPSLMVISNRIKKFTTQLWFGEQMTAAMVEPAYPNRRHPWFLTLLAALVVLAFIIAMVQVTMKVSSGII